MLALREVAGRRLLWVQPAAGLFFELRAGDEVASRLRWERVSLASGEAADQRWTFKREGFWHPRVTVRVPNSDANVAVFHPGWTRGGTLELGPGRQFRFGVATFWSREWDWMDELGQPLVHFRNHGSGLKLECEVVIESNANALPETPLLVVLGWYLLVLSAQDAQSGGG
jgi:hypothetical protein